MAARKVQEFTVRPLKFDAKLAQKVTERRASGEALAKIAANLKVSTGKAAMAELVGTTEQVEHDDPSKLARAIVKDRKGGASWGLLAARYGVTEGTARAAYEAASGESFKALDYRKRSEAAA